MSVPWFSSEASTLAGLSIGLSQKVMMVVLMMNQLVVGLTVQLLQLRKVMVAWTVMQNQKVMLSLILTNTLFSN